MSVLDELGLTESDLREASGLPREPAPRVTEGRGGGALATALDFRDFVAAGERAGRFPGESARTLREWADREVAGRWAAAWGPGPAR